MRHLRTGLALTVMTVGMTVGGPAASAFASGPPPAATAFAAAVIGPAGGSVSGFGITATLAPGAVASTDLIILTNWPSGLDVAPPAGHAVKTFGLQVCNDSAGGPAGCTSEFGNYPGSPAGGGTERVDGMTVAFGGPQGPAVNFGTAADKLVTVSVDTGGRDVYIYNPNLSTTAQAYPKLLPSTASNGVLTFQTFQPIVWTVTNP